MTHSSTRDAGSGLLGIDLGTASVKVVILDHGGEPLAQSTADYPVHHPHPGWAESDPQDWLRAAATAVREALATAHVRPNAIGLSGQMHGVVVTDEQGQPVRAAILWSDSRAVAEADDYRALPSSTLAGLANPVVPGMAGPILAWLTRNEPASMRAARWAMQPKDWLRYQITGEIYSEPSDASATLLYDLRADGWDTVTCDALGIDIELLPPLLPSASAPAGHVTAQAADLFTVPQGTPVAAGGADTAVAAIGTGLVEPGTTQLTIGTGIQIVTPINDLPAPLAPQPVIHTYRSARPHGWYTMAAVLNGGSTLDWVRQILGLTWAELYATALLSPQRDDPLFVPHLHGERTPWLDPNMRGAWTDLNPRHDRAALARSALEGVAIAIKNAYAHLPVTDPSRSVLLAGGGTAAPGWRQMLADALGRPLDAVQVSAASGMGAALLGGISTGVLPDVREGDPGERVATPSEAGTVRFVDRTSLYLQRLPSLRTRPPEPS
jgi:xylulokinase